MTLYGAREVNEMFAQQLLAEGAKVASSGLSSGPNSAGGSCGDFRAGAPIPSSA